MPGKGQCWAWEGVVDRPDFTNIHTPSKGCLVCFVFAGTGARNKMTLDTALMISRNVSSSGNGASLSQDHWKV